MFNLVQNVKQVSISKSCWTVLSKGYAIKSGSLGKKRFRLPVETDAHKLVNYVCGSNIYKVIALF